MKEWTEACRHSGARPVLRFQARHAGKLPRVGGHERGAAAARLRGNQDVVGADRGSCSIQGSADVTRLLGVLWPEREDGDRQLQKKRQSIGVPLAPQAFEDAVLQLEQRDARQRDIALQHLALEPFSEMVRLAAQEGDDDVRI